MDELLRLLALVKRDLGADDARAELGGRDPTVVDAVVWAPLGERWRVVATFDSPCMERDAKTERLRTLLAPFSAGERLDRTTSAAVERGHIDLDDELDRLAERTGARAAIVFDERSPVVWGCSSRRADGWDVETMEIARHLAEGTRQVGLDPARWLTEGTPTPAALRAAGVDDTLGQRWSHRFRRLAELAPAWSREQWHEALQVAIAVSEARARCVGGVAPERVAEHADDWGVFAKAFAQTYFVALVFDGPYS